MRAITTRYFPAGNNRAAYVKASSERHQARVTDRPGLGYSDDEWHRQAAFELCRKMKWSGEIIGGHTSKGMVWVFIPPGVTPQKVG